MTAVIAELLEEDEIGREVRTDAAEELVPN